MLHDKTPTTKLEKNQADAEKALHDAAMTYANACVEAAVSKGANPDVAHAVGIRQGLYMAVMVGVSSFLSYIRLHGEPLDAKTSKMAMDTIRTILAQTLDRVESAELNDLCETIMAADN